VCKHYLADEQVSALLVFANLTQRDSTRPPAMLLLDRTVRIDRVLLGSLLGGHRLFASNATGSLLGASHCFTFDTF